MSTSKIAKVHKRKPESSEKRNLSKSISSNNDMKSYDDKGLLVSESLPGVKAMITRLNENIVSSKNKKVSLRSVPSRKKVDTKTVDEFAARRTGNTKSSRIQVPLKLGSLDIHPAKLSNSHKPKEATEQKILCEEELRLNNSSEVYSKDTKQKLKQQQQLVPDENGCSSDDDKDLNEKNHHPRGDSRTKDMSLIHDGKQESPTTKTTNKNIDSSFTTDADNADADADEDDMIIGPSSENAWVEGAVYQINYNNFDETLFFYAFVSLYSKSTLTFMPSGEVELAIQEGDCTPVQFIECTDGLAVGRPNQEKGGGVIVRKMIPLHGVLRPIFLFLPNSYPIEGLVISFIGHDTNDVVMKKVRSFLYYISESRQELDINEEFDPMRPNQRVSLFDLDDHVVQKLSTATCLWERMDVDSYRIWATYKSHTVTRKIKMDWFQAWLKTYSGRVSSPVHLERVTDKQHEESLPVEWTFEQMKAAQQKIKKELKKRDGYTSKRKK